MNQYLEKVTNVPMFLFGYHKYHLYSQDAFYLYKDIVENYRNAVNLALSEGYYIFAVDGYRPLGIQRIFDQYELHASDDMHCKGLAVDVSMSDSLNYSDDKFQTRIGTISLDSYSDRMDITQEQLHYRTKLQEFMMAAGFQTTQDKWWHFVIDIPNIIALDIRPEGLPSIDNDEKIAIILSDA